MNYSCHLISNSPNLFSEIQQSIEPEKLQYFDGTGYPSFSKLVNDCVEQCPTETVIIMSDRVRPSHRKVKKVLRLLDKGYAFVGLYRFAFFGFRKQLFREIGPLDERFIGGGGEDDDFYMRLIEANLSAYVTHEVKYIAGPTRWQYNQPDRPALRRLKEKWDLDNWVIRTLPTRKLPNSDHEHDFGDDIPCSWLPLSESFVNAKYSQCYFPKNRKDLSNL